MSTIEANTLKPISGSSTLTLGESGDTVALGSGASSSGFGASLTGSTNNTVVTVTGANAMQGEANVTYADPKLMVANSGDSTFEIQSGNSNSCRLNFGDTDSSTIGQIRYRHDLNKMIVEVNGSSRLEIDNNGVVKATNRVIVDAEVNSGSKINAEFGGNSENGQYFNDKDGASNARYVGFERGGTLIGQIKRDGTNDSISYVTSSDYRLKDGVVDKTDGIEKIKLLKPRKFYWLSNPNQTLVDGFIAHEVSDVVPEAISGEKDATETYTDENGDEQTKIIPQGIDQSKLVPLLTAALKEAITKIETLEAKVAALESA